MKSRHLARPIGMRVVFAHLDLGIGGAERLVVNLALGLHNDGHEVELFTTHHSQSHSFAETKKEGVLGDNVHIYGDWLPRQIVGRCTALCSIVRMLYLCGVLVVLYWRGCFDVLVLDGVSAPLLLLRFFLVPNIFYCHYPDKLLCTDRDTWAKRLYRFFIDLAEDVTICSADKVLCNSRFTVSKVRESFWFLDRLGGLDVLYPPVEDIAVDVIETGKTASLDGIGLMKGEPYFVSLNRYERKKDIGLVLRAFLEFKQDCGSFPCKIVIAGGYDTTVVENVEYKAELEKTAQESGIEDFVIFRTSISDEERTALITQAVALLYTPQNEHFGIVPIESMLLGTPVIAADSGGPLETVVHGETGFLAPPTGHDFAQCMRDLLSSSHAAAKKLGASGRCRVRSTFLTDTCTAKLVDYLAGAVKTDRSSRLTIAVVLVSVVVYSAGRLASITLTSV